MPQKEQGLYHPSFEHDSCGVGFVVDIHGQKSHQTVEEGITVLQNLVHRGALGADKKTGDGAGILTQLPHKFFQKVCPSANISLPEEGEYGVAMVFLPLDSERQRAAVTAVETAISEEHFSLLGWRDVPVVDDDLGYIAKESIPVIKQFFVSLPNTPKEEIERKLFLLRKVIENKIYSEEITLDDFYISSLSSKTIVYKGMLVGRQVQQFYPDLTDEAYESALALVHQRYSTNTFPSWALAQPFRYVAHNGEINTIRGNRNKMKARESSLASPLFGEDIRKLFPIITENLSDSGSFDNVFELLTQAGRSMEHTTMMMVPEAFGKQYHISEDKRTFYEFHASIMEPWDGPAALTFTDGSKIGAVLDRNGLRPARFVITKNGKMVLASETGVLDFPAKDIIRKGRLKPGSMILVDTTIGRVAHNNEIKSKISRQQQYRHWLEKNQIELKGLFETPAPVKVERHSLKTRQKIFGYTFEDIEKLIKPMALNGQEPVSSMGNDSPLAILSDKPQLLYNYFKQLFAQVTNPPIDPYRENMVMSLMSFIGKESNLLEESPKSCHQLKLPHPILSNSDIKKLKNLKEGEFTSCELHSCFDNTLSLEEALETLCLSAEEAVDQGHSLIILSDRNLEENEIPIPALLATSAVHHHLVRKTKRHLAGLVIETGEAREVTHFATLVAYGASAINPYLAFETLANLYEEGTLGEELSSTDVIDNYITAIKKGLLKIMSKMGVSTIRSYKGAQIFEIVGLNRAFVDKYFTGTASRIEGIGLKEVEQEYRSRYNALMNEKDSVDHDNIDSGGDIHFRANSEKHLITPESIATLQRAVRTGDYKLFKEYTKQINDNDKNHCTIRGLLSFSQRDSIPLEEVESVESIVKRFVTSAMSFGSLSKEAHETLAIAMNRLGAMSNSGEGGEQEERYIPLENGDNRCTSVKQIASARFGVNSHYLVNAKELQIKVAQGAKPGEGGQLPAHKANETIAKVRHGTPGIMYISPPPHHDIYSIEDLSQLIYDLKNGNPEARVSVKLVAEAGVGTVAAGVAKGKADMILISGHDGGTGASPISSIKHAGIPWEIGLAETQQTLVLNNLRSRVRLQTDGKLKTGRDVVIAALLGAEEFGFGTLPLITMGCIMMRKCHQNTCPVGVATQDERLRKKFRGEPDHVVNFMKFIAEDTREIMASLGFRTIDEMVGESSILEPNKAITHWKSQGLDFSRILYKVDAPKENIYCTAKQEHDIDHVLDQTIIAHAQDAIKTNNPLKLSYSIRNQDRTVGAMLSSEISKLYGAEGLQENTLHCNFTGSAGQSFGAFLAKGVTFELEGDSNDYLGKGLSGGRIILYPPKKSKFRSHRNIITGNVNLFGATGGEVYINGIAGERFAVRNSGATAVVVGVGDHGCEYMTGGTVVVLSNTGINFAAGMSGGVAYVLDSDQLFDTRCNLEMVDIEPVLDNKDQERLKELIQNHATLTGSGHSARIIEDWDEMLPQFVKVMPIDYKKALKRIKESEMKETDTVSVTEEVYS